MKRIIALFLSLCLLLGLAGTAAAEPEAYTGTAKGFASDVTVTVVLLDGKVIGLEVDDSGETYESLGGIKRADSVEKVINAIIDAGTSEGVDATSGATYTSQAILSVVAEALAGGKSDAAMTFTPGEYEASAAGYNGTVTVKATLVASTDVSDDVAYTIVKTIFENKDEIIGLHDKGKDLSLEFATEGIAVPFAPGAAKYFAENGVTVSTGD